MRRVVERPRQWGCLSHGILHLILILQKQLKAEKSQTMAVKDKGGIKAIKGSRAPKTELNKYCNWVSIPAGERLLTAVFMFSNASRCGLQNTNIRSEHRSQPPGFSGNQESFDIPDTLNSSTRNVFQGSQSSFDGRTESDDQVSSI